MEFIFLFSSLIPGNGSSTRGENPSPQTSQTPRQAETSKVCRLLRVIELITFN